MEDMELKKQIHETYEKYGFGEYPDREQLVYEIIKIFRKNNVSIKKADIVLNAASKIIKIISTV